MARNRETKIELTAYDDLFQTDESRAEAALSKIRDIPLSEIDEFPDHPFKVLMDEDMEQLVESIKRNGVMTPATVRLKENGRYELISGHRRKKACELAGLETLKCEVKDLTRDEAIIIMVESNLQRSVILPSEKAFAYKMRLEAMDRQGKRNDLTSTPLVSKSRSNEELADKVGESREQIRRFIRLTELVPEILQMVDEKQIAFRPAVEISYLAEEQQYTLLEAMSYLYITVSHKTADEMADLYGFNEEQRQQLSELLAEENNSLWSAVLYGISVGDGEIVTVALSQVGNVGGQPYWSWYGFDGRVEWCACYVSWCANECGYIDSGVIPKFAGCANGVQWFKDRGQWQDSSFEPSAGQIIFFDWECDGEVDHVGIVEKCENGIVYTVEGNSGDACRQKQYAVGSSVIYGYGIPAY